VLKASEWLAVRRGILSDHPLRAALIQGSTRDGGVMRRWFGTGLVLTLLGGGFLIADGLFVAAESDERWSPEVIAHRGASEAAPENTLAAIVLAWRQGADAVEVDVRLSRDGQIVLMHDSSTERTSRHDARVANQTLAELKTLDVGGPYGDEWAGEPIPTLAEALATVPAEGRIFIDLKVGREIVPELVRVIEASQLRPAQLVVTGTSLSTLAAVKREIPDAAAYWIVTLRQHPETRAWLPPVSNRIHRARQAGFDGLNFRMSGVIEPGVVNQVRQAGLKVYVWTVNTEDEARQAINAGVDGITTDRPGWLRALLDGTLR
jgi:glycerophosphoryl diester phosphodiesterase